MSNVNLGAACRDPIEDRIKEAEAALGRQLIACIHMHERGSAAQRRLAWVALGLACKAVWTLEAEVEANHADK